MAKICFVLGAGGARGIAHIGFLQAMEENGIIPDCIAGCSMGSVVGACYAKGIKPTKMMEIVDSLKLSDIADVSLFPFNKKSLLRSVKLRKKLESVIGEETTFEQLEIPFECIAADIVSGEVVVLKEGSITEAIRASSAIPTVFHPVEKDGRVLVDGAILMPLPLNCVKDFKADIVIAVDVLGDLKTYDSNKGLLSHLLRVVDVNSAYLSSAHVKSFKPNLVIKPNLEDMSQYKVERLNFAYERGYKAGLENAKKILKIIKKK